MSKNPKERIKELRTLLHHYNVEYYVHSRSLISDFEFDHLMKELEELEEKYPVFYDENSPSKRVGGEVTKSFQSHAHEYPMLSLSNSYSKQDVIDFDLRVKKVIDVPFEYICELKYDGVAISLIYEDGELIRAVTRGDGTTGEVVTNNIRTISSIPLKLIGDFPKKIEVRGEVIFPNPAFNKLNKQRQAEGLPIFANPRNTASGSLKLQDSAEVAKRKLDCFLYAAFLNDSNFNSAFDQYGYLEKLGFKTPQSTERFIEKSNSIDHIMDFINYWEKERENLDFEIDGIVIKVNKLEFQLQIGNTAKSPRWAIAYKYKAKQVSTILKNITFQVGRTGAITPVAQLKPVEISGSVVKRASVHNEDQIKKLDLRLGDQVFVEKGGEIIPKVTGVLLEKRSKSSQPFNFIKHCPECNSELIRDEGEAQHYCPNRDGCPPQIKGKMIHFIGRKQMNIDGIGSETIDLLYSEGLVKNIADLYELKKTDILPLERMAEKSADNIIKGIEDSKKTPFHKLLFALGIRYVGETVAKKLVTHYMSMDALLKTNQEELESVDEIGDKIAVSVLEFIQNENNIILINRLKEYGLNMEVSRKELEQSSNLLQGKKIVVSGKFNVYSRDEIKDIITLNGGQIVSSVSAQTNLIVAGDNMGPSKLAKAKSLDIEILTEPEFLTQLGLDQNSSTENSTGQVSLF